MIVTHILFAVLFFICDLCNGNNQQTRAVPSLKFLVVVSKHGGRAPTHTYPSDPYRDRLKYWPEGAGQITKTGKRQMFKVGQQLRILYNGFLTEFYRPVRMMVQSTLVDRTMISAATLLAGLYPPQAHQRWHPDIPWQPLPIYPNLLDKSLLTLDPSNCPRYWKEQNDSITTMKLQDPSHADIYETISQGSGRNMSSCSQLYLVFRNLAAVAECGLRLPDWAQRVFEARMWPVVSRLVRDTTLKNAKMIKILNGLFLQKIVDLLEWRLEPRRRGEDLDMFIHVGHDITLMCMLAALGFPDALIPWAGTTLLLELHNNPALPSGFQVQVLKIDGKFNSTLEPHVLELRECPTPCDVRTFINSTRRFAVTQPQWTRECFDMLSD